VKRVAKLLVLAIPVAVVVVLISVIIRGGKPGALQTPLPTPASLPPQPSSYLGVFENGETKSWRPIDLFAKAVGKRPDIILYYTGWNAPFQADLAKQANEHGAMVLGQIEPRNVSIASIAHGRYDAYLRSYAASVRRFGHPVILGFGHEMNGNWYPWGYEHVTPAVFIAAWRHVVNVFRWSGARNVIWLWTISRAGRIPISYYWPGAAYVTWVGIDGYYELPGETFSFLFRKTLSAVQKLTNDPVLLSETAVGPATGNQPAKIANLFAGIRRRHLLGLVWFDRAQNGGLHHQDWRLEDSRAALAAFRQGVAGLHLMRP